MARPSPALTRILAPALASLALLAAPAAQAAPPLNDAPAGAGFFEVYSSDNGTAVERQAIAQLGEATPDAGVPPCLGKSSFARTVWYRIPATQAPRELTVEASGRTLDVVDLAAFVQPGAGGPPATSLPNACDGEGAGAGDAAGDATSAVTLRVGPYRDVLLQVGHRGRAGVPEDEQIVLQLSETELPLGDFPDGDRANNDTPTIPRSGTDGVALNGATTSQEDPAVPQCPSLAGVWRRARPPRTGRWTFTTDSADAQALTVFKGRRPSEKGLLGCIDREGPGALRLPLKAKRHRLLWVRIGTDRPSSGATAHITLRRARRHEHPSGGACLPSITRASVSGGLVSRPRSARARNRAGTLTVRVRVKHGPLCDAHLRLEGPRRATFATADVGQIGGTQLVSLHRVRKLRKGRYRLRVEHSGLGRITTDVPSSITFRLRR